MELADAIAAIILRKMADDLSPGGFNEEQAKKTAAVLSALRAAWPDEYAASRHRIRFGVGAGSAVVAEIGKQN